MAIKIYSFIFVMWVLMLIGGGLVVVFVGPFTLAPDIDPIITSGVKVIIALFLIFIWLFTLTKVKNWIFKSQVKS
jgi:type VI protein secretion system component VasK